MSLKLLMKCAPGKTQTTLAPYVSEATISTQPSTPVITLSVDYVKKIQHLHLSPSNTLK